MAHCPLAMRLNAMDAAIKKVALGGRLGEASGLVTQSRTPLNSLAQHRSGSDIDRITGRIRAYGRGRSEPGPAVAW